MNILVFILQVLLYLVGLILFFRLTRKIILGHDEFFDVVFRLISKCYGNIRQCFCKKSCEVDDDRRTVQDDREAYDSSSVWED